MAFGRCAGCEAKGQTIELLAGQVSELQKSLLALTDAKAYALRHPPESKPTPSATPPASPNTPARARGNVFVPDQTAEEIEESFVLQEGLAAAIQRDPDGIPRS